MRAEAASGESFGAESDSALWLDPVARSRGAKEDGKEAPFFYDVKWFSLISIDAACEYRAFSEERRGK
jgi:hypothetical protein